MKIGFLSLLPDIPWGGSEALWHATAIEALKQGHWVFTTTYLFDPVPEKIKELASLGAVTTFRQGYDPAITTRLYRRLKNAVVRELPEIKALKDFNPDYILVNQCSSYELLFRPEIETFLNESGIPYAIICHNYIEDLVLHPTERARMLNLFQKADQIFMICQQQANVIMKQLVSRLPHIRVVDNPMNITEVSPVPYPVSVPVQMASVASLNVDRKGQDILLEVLSSDVWKRRPWHLNFYGSGPHEAYLKELVHYYDLSSQITFKGHVHDIRDVWAENHILLISSRIETGPMVLTEAMCCGRPVVATQVGRVPDLVQDDINGFVAEAATVPLFNKAMERAWQHQDAWAVMGTRAYESVTAAVDLHAAKTFLNLLVK